MRSQIAVPQRPQSKIYYIFCKELFKSTTTREVVSNLDLDHNSLGLVIKSIAERHHISLDDFSVELYSREGYPMCVNEYNQKCKNETFTDCFILTFANFTSYVGSLENY